MVVTLNVLLKEFVTIGKKRVESRNQKNRGNVDNRANQLNQNNNTDWRARGYDKKPIDRSNASFKRK